MTSPSYRIEPLPGYAPTIGRLVGMLSYARKTTLAEQTALWEPALTLGAEGRRFLRGQPLARRRSWDWRRAMTIGWSRRFPLRPH